MASVEYQSMLLFFDRSEKTSVENFDGNRLLLRLDSNSRHHLVSTHITQGRAEGGGCGPGHPSDGGGVIQMRCQVWVGAVFILAT